MIICPNCQTENRSGAKFCRNCAARLPEASTVENTAPEVSRGESQAGSPSDRGHPSGRSSAQTIRLSSKATIPIDAAVYQSGLFAGGNPGGAAQRASNPRTDTKPLGVEPAFTRRPPGAIFADAFLHKSLVYSNERQNQYLVVQLGTPESLQLRVCSNPACGAYFLPREGVPEKFCTDCGSVLENAPGSVLGVAPGGASDPAGASNAAGAQAQELLLTETSLPLSENTLRVVAKGLSHSSVRAPLAAFEERLVGKPRYCLVTPPSRLLEGRPEAKQALSWGPGLARGLDYLHDNGISFGGQVEAACLALVSPPRPTADSASAKMGERAVWANFSRCEITPDMVASSTRAADTRALALLLFQWATVKNTDTERTKYEHDPNLVPSISRVFDQALSSDKGHPSDTGHPADKDHPAEGFASGRDLAEALEKALEEAANSIMVDFRMGRRTSVGMVRTLNEDSLMTLELNRFQQSVSQPLGIYLVADGMGGHAAGEVASGTIVNTIAKKASTELVQAQISSGGGTAAVDRAKWLRQAVEAANKTVFDMRKSAGTDMGSTLVSVLMEGNKAYITHIGDSRAYLINSGGIQRLTIDHSLVERLIATNQITREEARYHPQRNVIYRTIGDKQQIDVDVSTHTLAVGDYLLLCSDGLSGMLDDPMIQRIVLGALSPQAACDQLVAAANQAGGDDNVSVIIVQIVQV